MTLNSVDANCQAPTGTPPVTHKANLSAFDRYEGQGPYSRKVLAKSQA